MGFVKPFQNNGDWLKWLRDMSRGWHADDYLLGGLQVHGTDASQHLPAGISALGTLGHIEVTDVALAMEHLFSTMTTRASNFLVSQNHRMVWVEMDLKAHPVPKPCCAFVAPHQIRLPRATSNLASGTSRYGVSTASLGASSSSLIFTLQSFLNYSSCT